MKYQVVRGFDFDEFQKMVNNEIYLGWEPVGGVANQDSRYLQAMVKKEKETKKKK